MVVARRYARALYEEAERRSRTEAVDRDVDFVRESLAGSPELVGLFESPVISREKKQAVVAELFKRRIDPVSFDFLLMLIRKQREDLFPRIAQAYRGMRDEHLGIVEARARAAWDLSDEERRDVTDALGRMTGKKIRLAVEKDPDLIGGMVIRIGDTVYDGSVRHQLELLRDQMELGSLSLN